MTTPERRSAASATVITYGTNLTVAVLSLANVLIVSRALGPAGRGEVVFLAAIAFFTSSLASAGIEESNANFAASQPRLRRALATNSVVLALLLGVLAIGVVQGLIEAFPAVAGPSSSGLLWLTLGFIPVLMLNLYLRWLARADYAFAVTNIAWLVTPLANVVVNGLLALLGLLTVGTAVATWLAGQAAGTLILAWYVARRTVGFGRPDLRLMARALRFGLKTHAGRVMLLGNWRLDQWLLGAISGARELGLYSVAVAWAEALSYLPTAVKFVQRPYLVRSAPRDAVRQAAIAFRVAMLVTVVLMLGMVLAAPILCVTFFGEEFRGSIVELRVLVLGALGMLALTIFGNALVARGKPVLSSVALGAGFVCTVALDIVLIPPYAGIGAAAASAIAYTTAGALMCLFFVRGLGARVGDLVPTRNEVRWLISSARRSFQRGRSTKAEDTVADPGRVTDRSERPHYQFGRMTFSGPQSRISLESRTFPVLVWATAGVGASVVVAAAASASPTIAIGATVAIAAIAAVVAHPVALPMILAASVFMELVRVEGATISRLLAPVALIVIVASLVRGGAAIRVASPLYWVGAYLLWAVASGLWTTSVPDTTFLLSSLGIGIVYMLAFASLVASRRDLELVVWVFAIAALLFGALSLQHFSDVFAWGRVVEEGRSQGGVGDPNSFAATQLVALPLVIAAAAAARKRWLQIGLYATVLVIIASILTSLSRGGFIGLAVALTILVVAPFHLVFRTRRNKAIALLVLALGTAAIATRYSADVVGRAEGIFQEANPGTSGGSGRINLWLAARSSIEQHPWLGLGYGGFRAESTQLLLDTPGVDLSRYTLRSRGQPVHNSYLEAWTDLGIVGLFLYVGLLISTGRLLRRTAIHARRVGDFFVGSIAGALLIGFVSWSVISIFISTATARAFWIMIGLSLALPKVISNGPFSRASDE